jgi:predicted nucleotidyltransferase
MKQIEELKQRLAGFEVIRFAFLYGSRSRGQAHAKSDWDIAVYLDEGLSDRRRFEQRIDLLAALDDLGEIDLLVLNDAPPLLAQRALQGTRLFVKDSVVFTRFFVRIEAMAGDEQYWRQLHMRARKRRLEEGRFGRL